MADEYKVGYGKPPAKNKFKKGGSGNPKGRPKRHLDFQKQVISELKSPMTIIESGKKKKVSILEAFIKSTFAHALKGDKSSAKFVMDWIKALPKDALVDDGNEVHIFRITSANKKAMEDFMALTAQYVQEEAASSKVDND